MSTYRWRNSGLGASCGNPPLQSDFYGPACSLGQGATTDACLAAQDAAQQKFIAAQGAYFSCMGEPPPWAENTSEIIGTVGGPQESVGQILAQGPNSSGVYSVQAKAPPVTPASTSQSTPQTPPPSTIVTTPSAPPVQQPALQPATSQAPAGNVYNSSAPGAAPTPTPSLVPPQYCFPGDTSQQISSGIPVCSYTFWGALALAAAGAWAMSKHR